MRTVFAVFLLIAVASAVKVVTNELFEYTQPDTGEVVHYRLVGDEWHHHYETFDGFVVEKDTAGVWRFATETHVDAPRLSDAMGAYRPSSELKHKTFRPVSPRPEEYNLDYHLARAETGLFSATTRRTTPLPLVIIAFDYTNAQLKFDPATTWPERFFDVETAGTVNYYYNMWSNKRFKFTPATETYGTANDGFIFVHSGVRAPIYDETQNFGGDQYTSDLMDAISTVLNAASQYINFANYDTNSDGVVSSNELPVFFFQPGTEAAAGCTYSSGCPVTWAAQWTFNIGVGNVELQKGVVMGELGDCACTQLNELGTCMHELGHAVGLPDLYNTLYSATEQDGSWTLMNTASRDGLPTQLDAWSRAYLGWVDVQVVGDATAKTYAVTSIENQDPATQVYQFNKPTGTSPWIFKTQQGTGEFFLLENTKAMDFFYSPACGLLLWHVKYDGITTQNQVNCGDPRMVAVVSAGNQNSLEGSSLDVFPGSTNNAKWACDTTPVNSDFYGGGVSCITMDVQTTTCDTSMNFQIQQTSSCCGNTRSSSDGGNHKGGASAVAVGLLALAAPAIAAAW